MAFIVLLDKRALSRLKSCSGISIRALAVMIAVESSMDYAEAKRADVSEIPVIDISPLLAGGSPEATAAAIHEAATRVGFFYLSGHGIAPEVMAQAFDVSRAFFDQPETVKSSAAVDTNQRGWMKTGMAKMQGAATHDLKEVFFWGAPDVPPENRWPSAFPRLQADLLPYYRSVCGIGDAVLKAVAISFGLPETTFQHAYQNPMARGQLVYYPPSSSADEAEQRFGVAPHTDFGVLTFLLQDDNGGLQVRNRGGQWIEAPPIPGTLVCNIGDLLQRWTNDRFISTVHRVINRSGKKRYSIPVFFDPSPDALVDPRALGTLDADAKHVPITAADYIAQQNRKTFAQYEV